MRFNSDCSLLVYMLTCIQYFAVDGTMPQKHGISEAQDVHVSSPDNQSQT